MTIKVVQFSQIGAVTLKRNRRSKNIRISVKPDHTVLVSFPWFVSTREVTDFVQKNTGWITEQQKKISSRRKILTEGTIIETKLFTISILKGQKNEARRTGNSIEISLVEPDSENATKYVENILLQFYRFEAKKILPARLGELAKKHGFRFNKLTIRNNRRNWGSCSSKNNISLNLQMMKLPDDLIDYILLHELVHTEIKNHGPQFWEKLDKITGGEARQLAKKVREYSTYTL